MKFQVLLQWPASSVSDYDGIIAVEDLLTEKLTERSEGDGHDFGSDQANIFVHTIHTGHLKRYVPFSRDTGYGRMLESLPGRSMELEYNVLSPPGATIFNVPIIRLTS